MSVTPTKAQVDNYNSRMSALKEDLRQQRRELNTLCFEILVKGYSSELKERAAEIIARQMPN